MGAKYKDHPEWKEIATGVLYTRVYAPWHPRSGNTRRMEEHILVVEHFMGRALIFGERVHHVNEVQCCNHPNNLMVFVSTSAHVRFHHDPLNVDKSEISWDGRSLREPECWG